MFSDDTSRWLQFTFVADLLDGFLQADVTGLTLHACNKKETSWSLVFQVVNRFYKVIELLRIKLKQYSCIEIAHYRLV